MTALKPTATQMLYRFAHAAHRGAGRGRPGRRDRRAADRPARRPVVPRAEGDATGEPDTFVPFLMVFGWIGLAVAVLIVANVVSGAVVAGFKHIGVLKASGFTPTQVLTVYLAMVSIPAIVGCALGTVLGNVLAKSLLNRAFENYGAGGVGVPIWVDVATLLGVPALVALSALVPALRAREPVRRAGDQRGQCAAGRPWAAGRSASSVAPGCRGRSASVSGCRSPDRVVRR